MQVEVYRKFNIHFGKPLASKFVDIAATPAATNNKRPLVDDHRTMAVKAATWTNPISCFWSYKNLFGIVVQAYDANCKKGDFFREIFCRLS